MQIVTSPPKKILSKFLLFTFFVSTAAAELWLVFRWWCRFKQWPESLHAG